MYIKKMHTIIDREEGGGGSNRVFYIRTDPELHFVGFIRW
jgi:hypothetical protein